MTVNLSRMTWCCISCGKPWPDDRPFCPTPNCRGGAAYDRKRIIEPLRRQIVDFFELANRPRTSSDEELEQDLRDLYPGRE